MNFGLLLPNLPHADAAHAQDGAMRLPQPRKSRWLTTLWRTLRIIIS